MPALKSEMWNQNQINADIALKNRLYVSGYMLSGFLIQIRNGEIDGTVLLHYENDIPVGVAVSGDFTYELMVFVRKSMRNKGIGSKLLSQMNTPKVAIVGRGCDASYHFWRKNGYYRMR